MKNVVMKVEGNKLVIEIDLSQSFGSSKSGKTDVIASTEGNQRVHPTKPGYMIGLNIYKYRDAK